MRDKLYALILAGGGGSRLWPLSRQAHPKQFLPLLGPRSLLQETYRRIAPLVLRDHVYVVTQRVYGEIVRRELPEIPVQNILLEPEAKSTALAIGFSTLVIAHNDPAANILSLASDHVIRDLAEFRRVLAVATEAAASGDFLVTIGIKPTHPHPGYGYIHRKERALRVRRQDVYDVGRFVEKPSRADAMRFLRAKTYFWNASYFIFRASVMRAAIEQHMPELGAHLHAIEQTIGTTRFSPTLRRIYRHSSEVPIEYGVFERAKNVLVVPGDFGWSDIGDWAEMGELLRKNRGENTLVGNDQTSLVGIGTRNALVYGNGRMVALVGLEDVVVVDTDDVLLVCKKDRAQDVKKIVEKLKQSEKGASYY